MNEENDLIEIDDNECIKFILKNLPKALKPHIKEDDIQYVLDLICEYYSENELIDDDSTVDEATIAEEDMFNYIWGFIKKEQVISITEEDLEAILDGEFEYGKSIGIYTEE